jgi:hypothetical protein
MKKIIKDICRIFGFCYSNFNLFKNSLIIKSHILQLKNKHVFFGYYDVSPFSFDDKKILALVADPSSVSTKKSCVDIGYFEFLADKQWNFKKVGESRSWCWQQGCRLQWYPKLDKSKSNTIFYNTVINDRYVGIVQKLSGKIESTISMPIYDISNCGKYGLSLNFSRLQRLRPGYGYDVFPDITENEKIPLDDGIFYIDIGLNINRKILSYKDILKFIDLDCNNEFDHYINHLSFNPSATIFMFLYVIVSKSLRKTYLFTCKPDGSDLTLVNDTGKVSHYGWKNDNELLVFCCQSNLSKASFVLYDFLNKSNTTFASNVLVEDGHPSFLKDNKSIIVDTYPNLFGFQNLIIYNEKIKVFKFKCKLYSSKIFSGEFRTDLHPRINNKNTLICVDHEYNSFKAMRIIEVQNVIS